MPIAFYERCVEIYNPKTNYQLFHPLGYFNNHQGYIIFYLSTLLKVF